MPLYDPRKDDITFPNVGLVAFLGTGTTAVFVGFAGSWFWLLRPFLFFAALLPMSRSPLTCFRGVGPSVSSRPDDDEDESLPESLSKSLLSLSSPISTDLIDFERLILRLAGAAASDLFRSFVVPRFVLVVAPRIGVLFLTPRRSLSGRVDAVVIG
jgi:hypothetical protein